MGDGHFYHVQWSCALDIHPDSLLDTFQQVRGEVSNLEGVDYETDHKEVGTIIILSKVVFFT